MTQPNTKDRTSQIATNEPRLLAYAVPRSPDNLEIHEWQGEGFKVLDVPAGSDVSFLDYDGIVVFGGAFDKVKQGFDWAEVVCTNQADLDLRERELHTAFQQGKVAIFLLHSLPKRAGLNEVDSKTDLFRRIAASHGIDWNCRTRPSPVVDSLVPEFRDYIGRFGSGYVTLNCEGLDDGLVKPICKDSHGIYGVAIADQLLLLPCVFPQSAEQVQQVVMTAVAAAIAYRERTSCDIALWANEFGFGREQMLRAQFELLEQQAVKLEGEIDQYTRWKGALCFQSEPLVRIIVSMLDHFFGITLVVDDKCIEDATLRNDKHAILAVFEIKGVKGNFTRNHVNQVDSHRERLGLTTSTPGVLIVNTMMKADSLSEKEEPPHPDIVKKAVADNVLLVRTLDLLRFADGVEKGIFAADDLRSLLLTQTGWLRVEADKTEVLKD